MNLPPILKSELFWSAIVGIVSMILIALFPELEDNITQLGPVVLGLIAALIGGFTIALMQRQAIEGQIKIAEIQSQTTIQVASVQAGQLPHSHG